MDIMIDTEENEETVFSHIIALLPQPLVNPPDKDALPSPAAFQIFRKPLMRPQRKPVRNFEIINNDEPSLEDAAAANATGTTPAATDSAAPVPTKYRWLIEPNGSIQLRVRFRATAEGRFETPLEFEVMNTLQKYSLFCKGTCELPKINDDIRNVFLRRVKGSHPLLLLHYITYICSWKGVNPTSALPQKRFVVADNFYSFGPLSLFKKPDWKKELKEDSPAQDVSNMQLIESTNMDTIRLTNNGKYDCNVELGLENIDEGSR